MSSLIQESRMTAAKKLDFLSVEDYLAAELASPIKHEYLGGMVHAMPGARNVHNLIATNTLVSLGTQLRGKRCRPYNSDTKVRIRFPTHWKFYYPEAMVVCRPNPPLDSFQDEPVVVFEVLSKATRRIDMGEKKDAYLTIPSLCVYVMIEATLPAAIVYRRAGEDFLREVHEGLDAIVPLPEIDAVLPLAEVYADVEFQPEADDEDAN